MVWDTLAIGIDTSAPSDKASPSMVNHFSIFPTTATIEEILDKLLTRKIQEYYEGKLIDDHNRFAMLELNYQKLMTYMEQLHTYGQISEDQSFVYWKQCKKLKNDEFVDTSMKLENFKEHSKMTILVWVAQIQKFLVASHILWDNWVNATSTYLEINVAQH